MKWRIAVVELYEHEAVVAYLLGVLRELSEVHLYTTPSFARDNPHLAPMTTLSVGAGRAAAVERLISGLSGYDLVVNTTTMVDHRVWRSVGAAGPPWVTLVHNARWLLSPRLHWDTLTPAHGLRRVKWLLEGSISRRRETARRFRGLVFPSGAIAEAFRDYVQVPILGIPWGIWGGEASLDGASPQAGSPTVVVPGAVLPRQRDYHLLGEALARLPSDLGPVRVIILGRGAGREARRAMAALRASTRPGDEIRTYDGLVPEEEYVRAWQRASCVISLTGAEVPFATTLEAGGRSKVTGLENDQIRFARPMLVAEGYRGMPQLRDWQETFGTAAALRDLIVAAIRDPDSGHRRAPSGLSLANQVSAWRAFLDRVIEGR